MTDIPLGYCQCGCGGKTSISMLNVPRNGYVKGQPMRFIWRHKARKANKKPLAHGYIGGGKRNYEHIEIVEQAIGHRLPAGAEVHHLDGDRANNEPSNLVACQDKAYHSLLHVRQRALRESGNPNNRKCSYCGKWDNPKNLRIYATSSSARHKACGNKYSLDLYYSKKALA